MIRAGKIGILAVLCLGTTVAQDSVIHMKNGGSVEARIVEYGETSLSFRTEAATFAAQMPYAQIAYVELPEPDEWTQAVQLFEFGKYIEAAQLFERIAQVRNRATGYPAPGNFASLAQRRLLDCYRRTGDSAAVAKHLAGLEPDKLPPEDAEVPDVLLAWAAAGSGDWSEIIRIAEASAEKVSDASEQGIEMAYLKGLALKETGSAREAVLSFAKAYTLNAATDERISRAAFEEAARLVEQDEERLSEFQAQIHLYISIFGKGDLWADASENARTLAGDSLKIGNAALGQAGRTETEGEFMLESFGLRSAEQITADHMKKVGLGRKAAGAKKKE